MVLIKLKITLTKERLALLVGAGLAFFGALQLVRGFTALFAPVSNDYSEMMVAGMAQQLWATGRLEYIYAPPAAPYGLPGVQYPPLFIALTSLLIKLSGLGAVLVARLLSWSGYAAAGGMVGLLVWRETNHRRIALCAAFFPFTFWSVLIFINGARPDPLALLLSLLAVYLYRGGSSFVPVSAGLTKQTSYGKIEPGKLAVVALVLVLAFYSKQTYLAAGAAIFFDLLLTSGRRLQALFFAGCYAVLALFGLILCQVLSNGAFAGIFEPERAGRFIFHLAPAMVGFFLRDHAPLIGVALVALFWQWRQRQRFWSLYLFFAALACSSIVKDGAVDYYFNEVAYLLSIQVGLALVLFLDFKPSPTQNPKSKIQNLILALVGLQALVAAGMFVVWNQWRDNDNFSEIYSQTQALVREYQQSGKPALIWQNNFLIETNQTDLIGDYFIYWILLGNGHRAIYPFLSDLETGRYDLILVGSPEFRRWPPVLDAALQEHYKLELLSGKDGSPLYWLYTRR